MLSPLAPTVCIYVSARLRTLVEVEKQRILQKISEQKMLLSLKMCARGKDQSYFRNHSFLLSQELDLVLSFFKLFLKFKDGK